MVNYKVVGPSYVWVLGENSCAIDGICVLQLCQKVVAHSTLGGCLLRACGWGGTVGVWICLIRSPIFLVICLMMTLVEVP